MVNSILSTKIKFGHKYGDVVIAIDSKPYWRKEVFPHYKAHRKANRDASSIDWDTYYTYFNKIKQELIEVFPYRVIEVPGAEADDIIGTLALSTQEPTLIHASDGDFYQLARNPNVRQYSPIRKMWIDKKPQHELEWDLFLKIAKGDSGDGIPSCVNPNDCFVEGVRQKPLRESVVADWYANGIPEPHRVRFMENKSLIDLRETPESIKAQILEAYDKPVTGSKGKIYKWMLSSGLNQLAASFLDDLDKF
jgi:hypothetical protein